MLAVQRLCRGTQFAVVPRCRSRVVVVHKWEEIQLEQFLEGSFFVALLAQHDGFCRYGAISSY